MEVIQLLDVAGNGINEKAPGVDFIPEEVFKQCSVDLELANCMVG